MVFSGPDKHPLRPGFFGCTGCAGLQALLTANTSRVLQQLARLEVRVALQDHTHSPALPFAEHQAGLPFGRAQWAWISSLIQIL